MSEKTTRRIVNLRSGGEESVGQCERCGRWGTTIHHRKNRSQGGESSPINCVALCGDGVRGCHGWATVNPNAAHDEGFHVRPWEDPASVPVKLFLYGRAYLGNDGCVASKELG